MSKKLELHNFSGLNKGEINDFKDYLTLLKEGFLFNLDFNKIEIEGFNKNTLISYLYKNFNEKNDIKGLHSKLKEKIYLIMKKIINYDYSQNNKTLEEVITEVLTNDSVELGITKNIDIKLINVLKELYTKSSFLTRLDLMSVKGISKEEFKEIIYKELQLNPEDKTVEKKAIKKLNAIFEDTIKIMSSNFNLKIPSCYKNKKWENLDDFVNFAFSTSEEKRKGYLRVVDCAILKTMSAYNNIFDNPLLLELDKKLDEIIKKIKKIPGFTIIKEIDGVIEFNYNNPTGGTPNHTKGKISYRSKDDIKILLKLLYNRKYSKLNFFKDLLGFRIEIEIENKENGENAILLFKDLFEDNVKLKNKGFLKPEFSELCKNEYGINIDEDKKAGTNEDFINASLSGNFKNDNKNSGLTLPPAEIQFVYTGNKNEAGYNKHEIYDTKKYISAISRLFGYITLEDIKIIIHNFGLKSGLDEKGILRHLVIPKKGKNSFLMKTSFSSCGNCNYLLSRDVYDEKLKGLYKNITLDYFPLEEEDFENIYKKYLTIKV